ncbi:MAG: ribosome maturation factor RimM [Candidatus Sericytochromatia bacterium]|nr:ribosome maturation factor RimM [Candidatus Sericytochromatia bacterium]
MAAPPEWLSIAQIVTTHGVRGDLKLRPLTDDPLRLKELKTVSAHLADGSREELTVEDVVLRKDGVLMARFRGYDAPEPAARLRQAWLQVPYAEAKRKPGQILYADVLGLQAVDDASGTPIGEVVEVLRAGQDLLEIRRPDGSEVYVPWVDAFVLKVDREAGEVRLHLIEGMLE